jgi:hypothetical protein
MNEETILLDDGSLYERYGKPLEHDHHGKYIAISQNGRVIADADDLTGVSQAIATFGSGNFIFRRIGYSYVDKLRSPRLNQATRHSYTCALIVRRGEACLALTRAGSPIS